MKRLFSLCLLLVSINGFSLMAAEDGISLKEIHVKNDNEYVFEEDEDRVLQTENMRYHASSKEDVDLDFPKVVREGDELKFHFKMEGHGKHAYRVMIEHIGFQDDENDVLKEGNIRLGHRITGRDSSETLRIKHVVPKLDETSSDGIIRVTHVMGADSKEAKMYHFEVPVYRNKEVSIKDISIEVVGDHKKDACAKSPKVVHEGDKVRIKAKVEGVGDKKYDWEMLVSRNGFKREKKETDFLAKDYDKHDGEIRVGSRVRGKYREVDFEHEFKVRDLVSDRTDGVLTVFLTLKKKKHDLVVKQFQVRVSRSILLKRNLDPIHNCRIGFPAEVFSGIFNVGTDSQMELLITQHAEKAESEKYSKSKSWYLSPTVGIAPAVFAEGIGGGLGMSFNLGGYMKSRMKEVMRQNLSSISIQSNNTLEPGDQAFIWKQFTKHREAYDVYTINHCGYEEKSGVIYNDRWTTEMGVAGVNPLANVRRDNDVQEQKGKYSTGEESEQESRNYELFDVEFGGPVYNTCEELDTYMRDQEEKHGPYTVEQVGGKGYEEEY